MKLFGQILSSVLLLLISLLLVESAHGFKIIRGSSISTSPNNESNGTYWLSPSGNIAFGFYPLCSGCHRYVAGIWFVKSVDKILVWTANRNDPPLYHPSSIFLNNDGKLILRTAGGGERPLLLDVWEPISYAVMHDNGNFILYGYNSIIIWESFNYPTDTILGGQKLNVGQTLISRVNYFDRSYGKYMLRVNQYNREFFIYERYSMAEDPIKWKMSERLKGSLVTLNLDSTGRLYIIDSNNVVQKIYTDGENQEWQQQQQQRQERSKSKIDNNVIYRATLESDGILYLYRDRIGIEGEKTILIWDSEKDHRDRYNRDLLEIKWVTIYFLAIAFCLLVVGIAAIVMVEKNIKLKWPTIPKWLKIKTREKEEVAEKNPKVNLKKGLLS